MAEQSRTDREEISPKPANAPMDHKIITPVLIQDIRSDDYDLAKLVDYFRARSDRLLGIESREIDGQWVRDATKLDGNVPNETTNPNKAEDLENLDDWHVVDPDASLPYERINMLQRTLGRYRGILFALQNDNANSLEIQRDLKKSYIALLENFTNNALSKISTDEKVQKKRLEYLEKEFNTKLVNALQNSGLIMDCETQEEAEKLLFHYRNLSALIDKARPMVTLTYDKENAIYHRITHYPVTKKTPAQKKAMEVAQSVVLYPGKKEKNWHSSQNLAIQKANTLFYKYFIDDERMFPAQSRKHIAPTVKNTFVVKVEVFQKNGQEEFPLTVKPLICARGGSPVYVGKGEQNSALEKHTKDNVQQLTSTVNDFIEISGLPVITLNSDFRIRNENRIVEFMRRAVDTFLWSKIPTNILGTFDSVIISEGCDLHLMSKLPENLTRYKDSYIFIKNDISSLPNAIPSKARDLQIVAPSQMQEISHCVRDNVGGVRADTENKLFYVQLNGKHEQANIDNYKSFEEKINKLNNKDEAKIHLSEAQIKKIITANGGHIHPEDKGKKTHILEGKNRVYLAAIEANKNVAKYETFFAHCASGQDRTGSFFAQFILDYLTNLTLTVTNKRELKSRAKIQNDIDNIYKKACPDAEVATFMVPGSPGLKEESYPQNFIGKPILRFLVQSIAHYFFFIANNKFFPGGLPLLHKLLYRKSANTNKKNKILAVNFDRKLANAQLKDFFEKWEQKNIFNPALQQAFKNVIDSIGRAQDEELEHPVRLYFIAQQVERVLQDPGNNDHINRLQQMALGTSARPSRILKSLGIALAAFTVIALITVGILAFFPSCGLSTIIGTGLAAISYEFGSHLILAIGASITGALSLLGIYIVQQNTEKKLSQFLEDLTKTLNKLSPSDLTPPEASIAPVKCSDLRP